jgi:hypothetical protein
MPLIARGTLAVAIEFNSRETQLTLEELDANDIADHPGRADFGGVADLAVLRWLGVLSERRFGTALTSSIDFGRPR